MSTTLSTATARKNHHRVDLQIACSDDIPVTESTLIFWVKRVLKDESKSSELTLRIVSSEEITALNTAYRQKAKPTNVLAFPGQVPPGVRLKHQFLGDVIICPEVLLAEAAAQNTPLEAHWAHIVLHGVLHLLGFDHIEDDEAAIMQAMEIQLLAELGFNNPYFEVNDLE